jgi:hypothetical protein
MQGDSPEAGIRQIIRFDRILLMYRLFQIRVEKRYDDAGENGQDQE